MCHAESVSKLVVIFFLNVYNVVGLNLFVALYGRAWGDKRELESETFKFILICL